MNAFDPLSAAIDALISPEPEHAGCHKQQSIDTEHTKHLLRLIVRALDDLVDEGHADDPVVRAHISRSRLHAEAAMLAVVEGAG